MALAGHHEVGEQKDHTSAEWQIEAYSTAAPDFIGKLATVIGSDGSISASSGEQWLDLSVSKPPSST